MVDKLDAFTSLRRFVEELIAPSVRLLQEQVRQAGDRAKEASEEVHELRRENREILQFLHGELAHLKERVGKLEGRSEGLRAELTAVLEKEILKSVQIVGMKVLPPAQESGDGGL